MASIDRRPNGSWRARFYDTAGKQHARHFPRKNDAQRWLDGVTASKVRGDYVDPRDARITVAAWCASWLEGYATRRPSTVRQARVHVNLIVRGLGERRLSEVRPSHVKSWTAALRSQGYATSTVYATYRRLAQVMTDAVEDGLIPKSPCTRKTSPGQAEQRPYVATTEQVWALVDAMPDHLRPAVLLGAFAGLRVSEAAALRIADVDFMRGLISPAIQWPAEPLKTETSRTPIPIPQVLALELAAAVQRYAGETIVADQLGRPVGPWAIERAVRDVRGSVQDLPEGFRYHDLRHYLASLLIASGADVKVVQARLRHGSATTTLNVYGHLMPDSDESSRAAVAAAWDSREDSSRTEGVLT